MRRRSRIEQDFRRDSIAEVTETVGGIDAVKQRRNHDAMFPTPSSMDMEMTDGKDPPDLHRRFVHDHRLAER